MLILSYKTSEGQKNTITVPESWHEITVHQFQRMVTEWFDDQEDWVKLFSILSGENVAAIGESKDYKLESTLYATLRFVLEYKIDLESIPVPKHLTIDGKDIPIPKDIGRLSIGQAIQVRKSIEQVKDLREGISIATAVYLQPIVDNSKFDFLRAIEIEQQVLQMPIVKVFPVGFFLLRKLNSSGSSLTTSWLRILKALRLR